MTDISLIDRLLDVIEHDIVPKTADGVAHGNKLFGAAILRKDDRSLVLAETNNEIENPLWHGEVHCLKRFYEMPKAERVDTKDCHLPRHARALLALPVGDHLDRLRQFLLSVQPRGFARQLRHPARSEDPEGGLHPRSRRLQCRERLLEELFDPQAGAALPEAERPRLEGRIGRISAPLRRLVRRLSGEQGRKRHSAELTRIDQSNSLAGPRRDPAGSIIWRSWSSSHENRHRIPPQGRRIPGYGHRHAGWVPAVGAGVDAGRCRRRSGAGDPRASALPQARRHHLSRSADASLFRRPRLRLDPRRHARQRRFRRADGRRIFRTGIAGRLSMSSPGRPRSPGATARSA